MGGRFTNRHSPALRLGSRLYLRIWLAVLVAFGVLLVLVGYIWRASYEPQLREVLIRNDAGQVVGTGQTRPPRPPETGSAEEGEGPRAGPGMRYDFVVVMNDGQKLHVQMPRNSRASPWSRPPYGIFWMLGIVGFAVAIATYPIIRRLTRRLEDLQRSVEQWGGGDLSARVPVHGNDEIGYLATRFNIAAGRIEALVKSHKSLLANASHELRTPLTRIRMGLELMNTSERQQGQHDEISRSITELDQLIDEILLASRLDAPQAAVGRFEPVDLTGLLAEECARGGAELQAQGITVSGVPKLLRRLVRNLLENARRYSDGEARVVLSRTGERCRLAVLDRGPGVPPEQRERIFEPFYRLPGASEREGGVGLGLALVKSIALRHGGQVHCEANPAGGACFVVELPCQPSAPSSGRALES